jgi:hypothetical protein
MWFICSNANAENAFGLSRPLQLAPSFVSNMAGAGIINSNFFFLPPTEAPLADKRQDQRHRDEGVCARNHDAQVQPFHLLASFKKNPALGGTGAGHTPVRNTRVWWAAFLPVHSEANASLTRPTSGYRR